MVLSHQVPAAEVTKTPKSENISEKMRPMQLTSLCGDQCDLADIACKGVLLGGAARIAG
jgi:hypothetical protein